MVLPSAFDDDESKFRIDSKVLRASAVALLLTGYITTGMLCYTFKNILFQVEAIFLYIAPRTTIYGSLIFIFYSKDQDLLGRHWECLVRYSMFMARNTILGKRNGAEQLYQESL